MKKECKTIVVVEDDEDIRNTLTQVLSLEGYEALSATNGKEALELLSRVERPCLILLDLMMPVMNGWEFLQAMREQNVFATIPVIVVSAAGDAARSAQASGFVKKPVNLEALLNTVLQYCGPPAGAEIPKAKGA